MGTVKTAKSTGPTKVVPQIVSDVEVAALTTACLPVTDLIAKITDSVAAKLDPTRVCPQSVLRFRMLLDRMAELFGKAGKFLDERLKKFHDEAGSFAVGKIAVTFPSKPRRNPKWKEEATRLAAKVAELEGKEFDPEAYVKEITEATVPSISTGVELVESA